MYIGVYIADIIITTVTITVIEATITAITAIGETYRLAAVSKLALRKCQPSGVGPAGLVAQASVSRKNLAGASSFWNMGS